jgi:hypothetical protein
MRGVKLSIERRRGGRAVEVDPRRRKDAGRCRGKHDALVRCRFVADASDRPWLTGTGEHQSADLGTLGPADRPLSGSASAALIHALSAPRHLPQKRASPRSTNDVGGGVFTTSPACLGGGNR